MDQELNRVMGCVCERERYYYNATKVDKIIAEKDAEIAKLNETARKLKRRNRPLLKALYKACANWALSQFMLLDYADQGEPGKWHAMWQTCKQKSDKLKETD